MAAKADINKFDKKMKKSLFKITSRKQMEQLGNLTIGLIHDRTRNSGKGVGKPNGNRTTLKKVSKKYAKWRETFKDKHPKAASGLKSNLTLTGDMLDDMQLIDLSKSKFEIGYGDSDNQDKSDYQHAKGRRFLFLGRAELKQLALEFDKQVRKITSKI